MPKIGLRNIKTAIAVFLCLLVYFVIIIIAHLFKADYASNFKLATQLYTPFFACLATAYSISTDKDKSLRQAKLRLSASVIGGLIGLFMIVIYQYVFRLEWPFQHISATGNPTSDVKGLFEMKIFESSAFSQENIDLKFLLSFIAPVLFITLSVVITIWFCNLIKKNECSFIAVLTLTAVMSSLGTNPIIYGPNRILSTIIGILIALFVNLIKIPRFKNSDELFIVSLDGIYAYDNQRLNGYNAYKMNNLIYSGANITYFSTRTPISLVPMIGDAKLKLPVICMSGAALYDINNKKYLYVENIDCSVSVRLKKLFDEVSVSPFINIISDDVLYTYNEKLNNDGERIYANNRKNSAYGCYITGEAPHTKDVCYYVVVDTKDKIKKIVDTINQNSFSNELLLQVYDCYEVNQKDNNEQYSYLKIYSSKIKELNALKVLNDSNKKLVCAGTHENDSILLEKACYSITTNSANENIKNISNKVLNTTNNEKIFKELGKMYSYKSSKIFESKEC